MPFPPINLHSRISSPGKELFRKKKTSTDIVPPQSFLGHKSRDEKEIEREKLSTSWPSTGLKQMGRKPQQQATKVPTESSVPNLETDSKNSWLNLSKPLASSCDSVPRSSSGESAAHRRYSSRNSLGKEEVEQEVQFSLSLTPEAILVIQKRNLEKQMMAKQQKCCASADLRHRRVFPAKRAQNSSKNATPVAKLDNANDISTIVKISLLNDQYKYDDVEYEEEDGDVDETVMRKCKEWLKGVESAAAFGKVDKLSSLPHLKSC
ncbi:proline-rich protein 18 [Electrophorus electricus]|uniref:Proline rich 18 n=1 Tax=Electrophorus electricus TaxID=8005 RepID=A0A4W4F8T1_ELEEL|nr:proline-rich protein 18 [Electrophorus electricus]